MVKSLNKILLYSILTFRMQILFAQNNVLDSLQLLLKSAKEDTNKVNILYQLSEQCNEEDILKYTEQALNLAKKLNFKKGIASCYHNLGFALNLTGDVDKALSYYKQSIKINESIGNLIGAAGSLNNMGFNTSEKSVAMFVELNRQCRNDNSSNVVICQVNDNLRQWMKPLTEAFESTVEVTKQYEISQGRKPVSVEEENCGWDITSLGGGQVER